MKFVLSLMMFLLLSATPLAQGSGSSGAITAGRGERPFAVTKIVMGKVAEVKADDLLLVIEDAKGRKHEFRFTQRTKIQALAKQEDAPKAVPELQVGQKVKITYRDSDKTATLVALRK